MPNSIKQTEQLVILNSQSQLQAASPLCPEIQSSEPLWKRVPTRDPSGKPYTDFMMLIPGLRKFETSRLHDIVSKVEAVLKHYEKDIVLADLNLKINVLWVTMKPNMTLTTEIAALIHHVVPEAKLVSQHSAS